MVAKTKKGPAPRSVFTQSSRSSRLVSKGAGMRPGVLVEKVLT